MAGGAGIGNLGQALERRRSLSQAAKRRELSAWAQRDSHEQAEWASDAVGGHAGCCKPGRIIHAAEPSQPSHGGGKEVCPCQALSQREQSLPAVPGHGLHGPSVKPFSHGSHACGVAAVSFVPGMQRGPSAVVGSGIMAHIDPAGCVPSVTKVPRTGTHAPLVPWDRVGIGVGVGVGIGVRIGARNGGRGRGRGRKGHAQVSGSGPDAASRAAP